MQTPTTTGYCTDHLSDEEYGVGEPEFERALEFFRQMSLIRQRRPLPGNEHIYSHYPDVQLYLLAESKWHEEDAKRSRGRLWRGLTSYLSDLLGWKRRWQAVFLEEKEQSEMGAVVARRADNGKPYFSSIETGRRVDDELHTLCTRERNQAPPSADIHPYSKWFIQYCYQRAWLMCGAQVPLWSDDVMTPVRTQADAIVYDLVHRRFILIELKTGYDNDYETLLHVREPGDQFDDSYYWCHQHQLGWMVHKVAKTLVSAAGVEPTGVVLRVSECVGVRRPHEVEASIVRYYSETHERQSRDRYLVQSSNSMDPFASVYSQR